MATTQDKIVEQLAQHGITVTEVNVPAESADAILLALETVPVPTISTTNE